MGTYKVFAMLSQASIANQFLVKSLAINSCHSFKCGKRGRTSPESRKVCLLFVDWPPPQNQHLVIIFRSPCQLDRLLQTTSSTAHRFFFYASMQVCKRAEWLSDAICLKMDTRLSDVKLEEFDAVFIPGCAWNPDMLRTDEVALRLVRDAHRRGLLIASLCHGSQVLINAAFDAPEGQENFPAKEVHITGTSSIRRDLANAGFIVHNDDPVVYDHGANLLTARDPNDLGPLCLKLCQLLAQALRIKAPFA